jgi:3-oxoacyl-(acyl-carrier-protein) synthase
MGVISAVGNSLAENRSALRAGRGGITLSRHLPTRYAGILPFGEVPIVTDDLKKKLSVTDPGITRTTLLALHAFTEAIADAGLTDSVLSDPATALVGATTVGGMCLTDELYRDTSGPCEGSAYLSSYDCASVHMYLQDRYTMQGFATTINTACSSSANAIQFGARLVRNGRARRAIVGGTDSLAKFTINGFNALQILSTGHCRPFDRDRSGLNLGEGAAFLVLEGERAFEGTTDIPEQSEGYERGGPWQSRPDEVPSASAAVGHGRNSGAGTTPTGKKIYAELTGYCNTNDAFHPSALSAEGDGPFLAMKGALLSAGLNATQIDFINTHGTATENNDEAESRAMVRLFGEPPPFVSTKSYTGHTLGAAGAIEAVYSVLSLQHQEIYASLNFEQPIPGIGLRPVRAYGAYPLQHVMSNSFGFGGNCTSLIFSKVN